MIHAQNSSSTIYSFHPVLNPQRNRKPYSPPKIKTLTEEDLDTYSIFDVVMPLPGTDVAYPGGVLGERYRQFLLMDGLDPDNFVRKQKYVSSFQRKEKTANES